MIYKVSRESLKNASNCECLYSCLEGEKCGDNMMCKVVFPGGYNILFIGLEYQHSCKNLVDFGNNKVCRCPVRFEIFQRYNK